MAKKKDVFEDRAAVDEFFSQQFSSPGGVSDFEDAVSALSSVGLRIPHLCLRLLFQRSVFPLERSIILFGPPKSNKSSFLYYLYKLFRQHRGKMCHLETEGKDTPMLRLSVMDYDRDPGMIRGCETMDEFQQKYAETITKFKAACTKKGGPGRTVPLIIGIDSLTAKMTEDAIKTVKSHDGAMTRRFADEARSLSDWFKYAPSLLKEWPISLVSINHDKPIPGQMPGQVTHKSPGGVAPNFSASYRILMQYIGKPEARMDGVDGNRISLKTEKNSLGGDMMKIEAEIVWRFCSMENTKGKLVRAQQTEWRWDKATTETLWAMGEGKIKGWRGRVVDEMLGIRKQTGGKYSCDKLDIPSSAPLPADEFARILETRRDILDELEPMLGIYQGPEFVWGVDYNKQVEAAKENVADALPAPGATPVIDAWFCNNDPVTDEEDAEDE